MSIRALPSCHEFGIRAVLASIESAANRYKRHIVPVLSFQVDFYLRVFVRVYTSAAEVKRTPTKLAYTFVCQGCGGIHLQPVGKCMSKGDPNLTPNLTSILTSRPTLQAKVLNSVLLLVPR